MSNPLRIRTQRSSAGGGSGSSAARAAAGIGSAGRAVGASAAAAGGIGAGGGSGAATGAGGGAGSGAGVAQAVTSVTSARHARRERRNSIDRRVAKIVAILGARRGSVNRRMRPHRKPFFRARITAKVSTGPSSAHRACTCAAATSGCTAAQDGFVARSSAIVDGTVAPRDRACPFALNALAQYRVVGLDGLREAQVGERVFMCAECRRRSRKRRDLP